MIRDTSKAIKDMTEEEREELIKRRKKRCLKYLKVYIQEKDNSAARLRGFIDGWYGFHKKGEYLNKNLNGRWLNNPDCTKPEIKACLEGMDFISVGARAVLDGLSQELLIKEHAVPVKVIRDLLLELPSNSSLTKIEGVLLTHYKLGALTKDEDNQINKIKVNSKNNSKSLRSDMPDNWDKKDMFARYVAAGIKEA